MPRLLNRLACVIILVFASSVVYAQSLQEVSRKVDQLTERHAWSEAEEVLSSAIRDYPDEEWLYSSLAWVLREQKEFDGAIEVARDANRRFNGSQRSAAALAHSLSGKASHLMNNETGDPLPLTGEAIQLTPNDAFVMSTHARALRTARRFDESIELYKKVIERFPERTWEKEQLALTYIGRAQQAAESNPEGAVTDYGLAYEMLPEKDYIILHYAIALKGVERFEESVAVFEKGVALHPDNQSMRNNFIWTLVFYAQRLKDSDPTRSLELAERAYEMDPGHDGASYEYAMALIETEDFAEAVRVSREGYRRFPDKHHFCSALTLAYHGRIKELHNQNKDDQALVLARELPNLLRGDLRCDTTILLEIDKAFAILGRFEEGMGILEGLANQHPNQSRYSETAGYLINRYSIWLRANDRVSEANRMRDRANVYLRRAMDVYEQNHPNRPEPAGPVRFPMDGLTLVIASFDTGGTHSGYGKYCYDFATTNSSGSMTRPDARGRANSDYYGFGEPIYAVRAGVVDIRDDGDPDPQPRSANFESDGNYVRIKHEDGTHSWYAHLKNGSVTVQVGDRVRTGQKIGELGNSGMSTIPHLHFCLVSDDYVSIDFRFEPLTVWSEIGASSATTSEPVEQGSFVKR